MQYEKYVIQVPVMKPIQVPVFNENAMKPPSPKRKGENDTLQKKEKKRKKG